MRSLWRQCLRRDSVVSAAKSAAALAAPQRRAVTSTTRSSDDASDSLDLFLTSFYAADWSRLDHPAPRCELRTLLSKVRWAMRVCLAEQRPSDAWHLYRFICSSGLHLAGDDAELDYLATVALRHMPHHAQGSATLQQLRAAEESTDTNNAHTVPFYGVPVPSSSLTCSDGAWQLHDDRHIDVTARGGASPPSLDPVEEFRIRVCQRTQLLRAAGLLQLPTGRDYLLTEARNAVDSPGLRSDAEVSPLITISDGILRHPLAHAERAGTWADHAVHLDRLGISARFAVKGLSAAQMEGILQIEEDISALRALCQPALRFLTTVTPDWDEVLHRRVAECLLIPAAAHDRLPFGRPRHHTRLARQPHSRSPLNNSAVHAALEKWTSPAHDVFSRASDTAPHFRPQEYAGVVKVSIERAERIVRRRAKRSVVVPDAGYILSHFHQLQQLAKHREIVLTHGVLLELVRLAALPDNPRRFQLRQTLRSLMLRTTTQCTALPETGPGSLYSVCTRRGDSGVDGGVTVLGLQDELALLECSRERLQMSEQETCSGAVAASHSAAPQCRMRPTHLSAVLVAKQLEEMLMLHARGDSLARAQADGRATLNGVEETLVEGEDDLIDKIVRSDIGAARAMSSQHEVPLFRSRSRAFWAAVPVLVATTDENTRLATFMLGMNTYPPSSIA